MENNNTIRWVLIVSLVVIGIYLVIDHGQHVFPYLPFTFLFGCLFMHLFIHGKHGISHDSKDTNNKMERDSTSIHK